jgi:hypothetical protein
MPFERRVIALNIDLEGELDSHNPAGDCTATDCKKTCRGSQSTAGFVLREDDHIRFELDTNSILEVLRGGRLPP